MTDYVKKLLPRFRYGVIQPRAHEEVQRARSYQLYRLLPLDFMEISTGLGLENYTKEGVEKAINNYWACVERLAKEKVDHIIFSGAPISAMLTRPRVLELLRETKEKTGISADAPLDALICRDETSRIDEARDRQPLGGPGQRCNQTLPRGWPHRRRRHHEAQPVGIGLLRHEFGTRLGNGPRCRSGGGKNLARGRSDLGARRCGNVTARHPGYRGRIWQTSSHQHER
jgi:hypothetical protein